MNNSYKHINEFDIEHAKKVLKTDYLLHSKNPTYKQRSKQQIVQDQPINDDDIEDIEEDPIFGTEEPKEDPAYKAINAVNNDNSVNDDEFKKNLLTIAKAHNAIQELYVESLYEESWDNQVVYKFENLLEIYNKAFAYIKEHVKDIQWHNINNKNKFFKIYNDVIKADQKTFNIAKARNENYKRYRTNRKAIILQLAKIIGRNKISNDNIEILNYFNNKCAKIPLYDNRDAAGNVTLNNKPVLQNWCKQNITKIDDEIADETNNHYERSEIYKVFKIYVDARNMAFKIFNMITSKSKYNGWDKFNNLFVAYCDGKLNNAKLTELYNAAGAETEFEDVDDYNQIKDVQTWNRKGIYESWWDDDLEFYKNHRKDRYSKDKIQKIEMLDHNANICKVVTDGKYVYANETFYPGDIIEICPTKPISKSSLYSSDMRDIVFEVVANKEWVVPFGYCQYYDFQSPKQDANCDFLWDPINKVIVIKAINKIQKYNKLILKIVK